MRLVVRHLVPAIQKYSLRFDEVNAVLPGVLLGLARVPFELHSRVAHLFSVSVTGYSINEAVRIVSLCRTSSGGSSANE